MRRVRQRQATTSSLPSYTGSGNPSGSSSHCALLVLNDADEIATKFDGTGYIGIVPHRMIPAYCESLYPEKYGRVVDFMNLFDEDKDLLPYVEWLPEEKAELEE